MEVEINRQKKEYELLLEENCQALEELQQLKKLNSEQQAQSMDQSQKIKELHRELEAKEELVLKQRNFYFNCARVYDFIHRLQMLFLISN